MAYHGERKQRCSTILLTATAAVFLLSTTAAYGVPMYVSSKANVLGFDVDTGAPMPAPGQTGAMFSTSVNQPAQLEIGPDHNADATPDHHG